MRMVQEETRKGPWTEKEDLQLVYFVGLLGERRWDFLAKVSGLEVAGGLNRTGKSCRLRWVNYLHPDLKHGRMTPHEERLVLELHSRWGNRWSRIARKLPGRTDNEIKNYWRTHMRKKAQERKRASSSSSLSTSVGSSSSNNPLMGSSHPHDDNIEEGCLHDKGSCNDLIMRGKGSTEEECAKGYSIDQIWEEIASSEEVNSLQVYDESCKGEGCNFSCPPPMDSPLWDDYCSDSLWRMDEEVIKMLHPMGTDLFISNCEHNREYS